MSPFESLSSTAVCPGGSVYTLYRHESAYFYVLLESQEERFQWRANADAEGNVYYVNLETHESVWALPDVSPENRPVDLQSLPITRAAAAFYAHYNPEKVDKVLHITARYYGREVDLMRDLYSQYRTEGFPFEAHLFLIYARHSPAKIGNVPQIAKEWDGSRDALWARLQRQYTPLAEAANPPWQLPGQPGGTEAAPPPPPPPPPPRPASPTASRGASGSRVSVAFSETPHLVPSSDGSDDSDSSSSSSSEEPADPRSAAPPPTPATPDERGAMQQRLVAFYSRAAPDKIPLIPAILQRYEGRYADLSSELTARYPAHASLLQNPQPQPPPPPPTPPACPASTPSSVGDAEGVVPQECVAAHPREEVRVPSAASLVKSLGFAKAKLAEGREAATAAEQLVEGVWEENRALRDEIGRSRAREKDLLEGLLAQRRKFAEQQTAWEARLSEAESRCAGLRESHRQRLASYEDGVFRLRSDLLLARFADLPRGVVALSEEAQAEGAGGGVVPANPQLPSLVSAALAQHRMRQGGGGGSDRERDSIPTTADTSTQTQTPDGWGEKESASVQTQTLQLRGRRGSFGGAVAPEGGSAPPPISGASRHQGLRWSVVGGPAGVPRDKDDVSEGHTTVTGNAVTECSSVAGCGVATAAGGCEEEEEGEVAEAGEEEEGWGGGSPEAHSLLSPGGGGGQTRALRMMWFDRHSELHKPQLHLVCPATREAGTATESDWLLPPGSRVWQELRTAAALRERISEEIQGVTALAQEQYVGFLRMKRQLLFYSVPATAVAAAVVAAVLHTPPPAPRVGRGGGGGGGGGGDAPPDTRLLDELGRLYLLHERARGSTPKSKRGGEAFNGEYRRAALQCIRSRHS